MATGHLVRAMLRLAGWEDGPFVSHSLLEGQGPGIGAAVERDQPSRAQSWAGWWANRTMACFFSLSHGWDLQDVFLVSELW